MKILIGMLLFFTMSASATPSKVGSFAPPNDKKIPEHGTFGQFMAKWSSAYGIAESDFNAALDKVARVWGPRLQAKGYQLVFNRKWSDPTVNADTYTSGNQFIINAYGGLARSSGMTANGYVTVTCHELGHHLGGAPLYPGEVWNGGGPSNEGESDYWATKECMKDLGFNDNEIAAGALSTASVLAGLGGGALPNPNTPDQSVVSRTNDSHPRAQCRLDTYLAGLNCTVRGTHSNTNPKINSCYSYPNNTAAKGSRPRCWFKNVDQGTPTPGPAPIPDPTPTPNPGGCQKIQTNGNYPLKAGDVVVPK